MNSASSAWWKKNDYDRAGTNSTCTMSVGRRGRRMDATTTRLFGSNEDDMNDDMNDDDLGEDNDNDTSLVQIENSNTTTINNDKKETCENNHQQLHDENKDAHTHENKNETPSKRRRMEFHQDIHNDIEDQEDESMILNEDDDEQTQKYSMSEEDKNLLSIDDTTQPYTSIIENDDDEEESQKLENDDNEYNEKLLQIDSQPFLESSPIRINTPTAPTLNQSCALPSSLSPKLSPIAVAQSPALSNGEKVQCGIARSCTRSNEKKMNGEKDYSSITFETLFQSLLKQIDNASGETQLSCNNGLFEEYCIYFPSDFDQCLKDISSIHKNSNVQIGNSSKPAIESEQVIKYDGKAMNMTKSRICLLLKLCGAEMKDILSHVTGRKTSQGQQRNQSLVLVPTDSSLSSVSKEDIKLLTDSLKNKKGGRGRKRADACCDIAVVGLQWVLDSILNFRAHDIKDYIIHVKEIS